jgi:predicted nucleic acid-binding protein
MARIFLDTSALIKLYRTEPDSPVVQACVAPSDELFIARITPLEYRSAFFGLVRQGLLSLAGAQAAILAFESDLPQYVSIVADEAVFVRAQGLLDTWAVSDGLRPLDALQLASALEEHARQPLDALITTDIVLAHVARASGLVVKP